ncbi:hypothetical protein EVAR_28053_1 [Eumeta japonica]|uniref:Uncharacterized protein n=1 Tax=Eumeta variegata TaxID=151549 RepID=A0A4C1W8I5_EUMVA|nr:hypothetical protein EVAR_28053_1 [Eumeta japonica]
MWASNASRDCYDAEKTEEVFTNFPSAEAGGTGSPSIHLGNVKTSVIPNSAGMFFFGISRTVSRFEAFGRTPVIGRRRPHGAFPHCAKVSNNSN